MGSYSELYVGKLLFSFKNTIPSFLTFLFEKDNFYSRRDPADEASFDRLGYVSTKEQSLEILDRFGFGLDFCARVYEFFYDQLLRDFLEALEYDILRRFHHDIETDVVKKSIADYFSSYPHLSRHDEIMDFVRLLSFLVDPKACETVEHTPPPQAWHRLEMPVTRYSEVLGPEHDWVSIDFDELSDYLVLHYESYPPGVILLCRLFGDWVLLADYAEVVSIALVRLALEAVESCSETRLELKGIVEDEKEVRDLHDGLITELVEKIRLYNTVFESIVSHQEDVRKQFNKAECRSVLRDMPLSATSFERGRLLERLVEMLFDPATGLSVIDKNVRTGDEEIDLLLKNNVDRPFWMAFGSPLVFVECKNWKAPVGASEMRDFEGKMRNHGNLTKLGYFISLSGFTSEVYSELKRSGRDNYHIVTLTRDDIETYLSSTFGFIEWLESKTVKFR